jgi:CDI toxin restriction endonuclease-like domain
MMRSFRLTNEPGGMGLSCTGAGLSLAGVPLLRKTQAGFVPRSAPEVASLTKAAYGAEDEPAWLHSSLGMIAEALNRGDLVRASIAAVLTRTPELSWEAAARLANADLVLSKYDPNEPRDWHGRWTSGDAAAPASAATPDGAGAARQDAKPIAPPASDPARRGDNRDPSSTPAALDVSDDTAGEDDARDDSRDPTSPTYDLEQKYDDLGPVEFAKQVIAFGDRLGRTKGNLSPADKAQALAEYSFLQDRLSFWLRYDYTPPAAQLNLHSAALTLYEGAVNGGLAGPGDMPASMVDVAGVAALGTDSAPANIRPATAKPELELPRPAPEIAPKQIEGIGGLIDNHEVGIVWGTGLKEQGHQWETYNDKNLPGVEVLHDYSTGFDQFRTSTGEAIDSKTLDTLTVSVIKRPQQILSRLKGYIHKLENYRPIKRFDLAPERIKSKTLQLAIPEYTSPTQWRYLNLAIRYAHEHGVSVIVTRIRG